MTIELYTWGTPNGRKVSIALEEMELDYRVHPINIGKDEQFDPEFLKISPNNKIPAIVDGETGRSVMESGAILIYLSRRTGRFLGDDPLVTLEWLMFQMGGIGPMFGQTHHFLQFNRGKSQYAEERFAAETKRLYGVLNRRLASLEYLAGTYTIADMATWPWVSRWEWHEINWSEYPNVQRWYCSIAERDAVQKGYNVPIETKGIPIPD